MFNLYKKILIKYLLLTLSHSIVNELFQSRINKSQIKADEHKVELFGAAPPGDALRMGDMDAWNGGAALRSLRALRF